MVCPKCGNDNPSERAFCANCAAALLLPAPDSLIEVSPASFNAWSAALADDDVLEINVRPAVTRSPDAILWPSEAVFAPTTDPDIDLSAADFAFPPLGAFEDDQADDFFEQSLSGVKLEDLEDDESPEEVEKAEVAVELEAIAPTATPPQLPLADIQIAKPDIPVQDPAAIEPLLPTAATGSAEAYGSNTEIPPQEVAVDTVPVAQRRRVGRFILSFVGWLLLCAILFCGGVATGVWLIRDSIVEIPGLSDVPSPGERIRQTPKHTGMGYVPGGEFFMGSDAGDRLSKPAHRVTVQPFLIDLTEVTNEDYLKFVIATRHDPPRNWNGGVYSNDEGRFPVTGVTWYDAAEYAAWMGKRLPTEAEWEFAARGSDGRMYPWGDEWDAKLANAHKVTTGIRNVGEGGTSPFGLYDMSGNAWEWTSSDAKPYSNGSKFPWSRLRLKIIRGGNWQSDPNAASAVFRGYYGADGEREYNSTSFRCVKDVAKGPIGF